MAALYRGDNNALPGLVVNEFTDRNKFRNDKPKWFLELNPNGKVPTFVDPNHNVVLYESCAILFYLIDTYDVDGLMLPRNDPRKRGLYQQLAFFSSGTLDNLSATSSPIQRAVNMKGSDKDLDKVMVDPVKKQAWLSYGAEHFEQLLAKEPGAFLLGETISAADIVFGTCLYGFHEKMINRGDGKSWLDPARHPRICKYYFEEIQGRELRKLIYTATNEWPSITGVTVREAQDSRS